MSGHQTIEQPTPTCPHCGYALDEDEMNSQKADLRAAAALESREVVVCPICDKEYWIQGGFKPHYTSAFCEEEFH